MENILEVVELYLVLLYVLLYIGVHQCTAVQQPSVDHHKFKIRTKYWKRKALLLFYKNIDNKKWITP